MYDEHISMKNLFKKNPRITGRKVNSIKTSGAFSRLQLSCYNLINTSAIIPSSKTSKFLVTDHWNRSVGEVPKCLLCKHKDRLQIPSTHVRSRCDGTHLETLALWRQRQEIKPWSSHYPAPPANQ